MHYYYIPFPIMDSFMVLTFCLCRPRKSSKSFRPTRISIAKLLIVFAAGFKRWICRCRLGHFQRLILFRYEGILAVETVYDVRPPLYTLLLHFPLAKNEAVLECNGRQINHLRGISLLCIPS